jgi:hypothetical protein
MTTLDELYRKELVTLAGGQINAGNLPSDIF